jgi:hypothetical protein
MRRLALTVLALGAMAAPAHAAPVRLVAAGDIACQPGSSTSTTNCQYAATQAAVQSLAPDVVAALGDNQYDSGWLSEYNAVFDGSWGQFKPLIRPVPGNHEYAPDEADPSKRTATGYFDYFGTAAAGEPGKGWYSYDLGDWHVVALNSNCSSPGVAFPIDCTTPSEQVTWLRQDLAANGADRCVLAYWHHPRFASGSNGNGNDVTSLQNGPFWQALYDAGADVIINGHDHDYERFGPQDPSGAADALRGIREFVVGTGGDDLRPLSVQQANSEVFSDQAFGVLELVLDTSGYSWRFHAAAGPDPSFTDSGSGLCHHPKTVAPPPAPPADPAPTPTPPPSPPAQPAARPVAPRALGRRTTCRRRRCTTTGTVTPPSGVSRAQACRGRVRVTITRGRRRLSLRTATLTSRCAFRSRSALLRVRPGTRVRVDVRFLGHTILRPRSAARQVVRVR